MDKSVKWLETPPPSDTDPSDSPTLSIHTRPKRKRSNIFTKIRKSLLGLANDDSKGLKDHGREDDRRRLKRALSLDAGLHNRISQLTSMTENTSSSQQDTDNNTSNNSKPARLRRSKSLIANPDVIEPVQQTLSNLQSPKEPNLTVENDDPILEKCENSSMPRVLSLINTIENTSNNLDTFINSSFNCSWLAPTRKSQLFPGKLLLLPKSASLQFQCQHFNRTIRLKFHFDDILNIARGTWNEQRNQALIIDLVRGKRKSWVFVAWTEDQYQTALDALVRAWRLHCFNQIKSRLDRKRAHLSMKYCRVLKEADQAHETAEKGKITVFDPLICMFTNAWKLLMNSDSSNIKELTPMSSYSLKHVLFEDKIPLIVPQALALILTEQATNFMTNFRALHGIVITNDSGWSISSPSGSLHRSFISLVTKEEADEERAKLFKWKIEQEFRVCSTDHVVIEAILRPVDSPKNSFKMIYELSAEYDQSNSLTSDPLCHVKITGQQSEQSSPAVTEEETCKYFRDFFFKSLFELLQALIEESQNEFDTFESEFVNITVPPHFRFVKENIRNRLLKANLLFTTVFLPLLYKIIYFKEFNPLRFMAAGLCIALFVSLLIGQTATFIREFRNRPVKVEDQFTQLMQELSSNAIDSANSIHSLKLKYSK